MKTKERKYIDLDLDHVEDLDDLEDEGLENIDGFMVVDIEELEELERGELKIENSFNKKKKRNLDDDDLDEAELKELAYDEGYDTPKEVSKCIGCMYNNQGFCSLYKRWCSNAKITCKVR